MKILIIDDEEVLREVLETVLRREGFDVLTAASGEEGLSFLDREEIDLIILDMMLPGMSGAEALRVIKETDPDIPVVIITAYSSIDGAIDAMKRGAFHYIPKPFKNEEVVLTVTKALEQRRLSRENQRLKDELSEKYSFSNIIGKSEPMRKVFDLIRLAAPSRSNILLAGESGTGKELVAKAIHHASPRARMPFVTVNSGSLPPELLESNLFGHVKGAFTGAIATKRGLFEVADGGSIFLDEIGTINLETQAKLLRVIQEKEFMRLGSVETIRVAVRIIAASNIELVDLVEAGQFREDLFYRLNVIKISLPPLRRRREDT
ncbi:MAG TPA: sigma-54 dependent transcriptional regulator, partial [Thermoanaerobaculia bacterium]